MNKLRIKSIPLIPIEILMVNIIQYAAHLLNPKNTTLQHKKHLGQ